MSIKNKKGGKMIRYDYYIEDTLKQTRKKFQWIDIVMVLITILLFVFFGMQTAQYVHYKNKEEQKIAMEQNEINQGSQTNNTTKEEGAENAEGENQNQQMSNNEIKNMLPLNKEQIEKVNNIYNTGEGKTAYLTFDDGPSQTVTPLILDLLKQEKIQATFFTLGIRVEQYPELVKRAWNEGHYIANHGYSHRYKDIYCSIETVLEEYNQTEKAIQWALRNDNYHSRLFRFPGGSIGGTYHELKQQAVDYLEQNGIAHINWNTLTNDAIGTPTKESILANLEKTMQDKTNVVILMHDAGDKILTYETLPDVIQLLKDKGYQFKSFKEIMSQ